MRVMAQVVEGELPNFEADNEMSKVVGLCNLMKSCFKQDPNDRPDATKCLLDVLWMASRE